MKNTRFYKLLSLIITSTLAIGSLATVNLATAEETPLAVLVPGSGTYSRPISTDSIQAQAFFDQGLRMRTACSLRATKLLLTTLPRDA